MRRFGIALLVLASGLISATATAGARDPVAVQPVTAVAGAFTLLCYHEVRIDVRDYPDPSAVDSAALARQFEWLRGNGYVPVSLDQIVAARRGGKPLPAKAVLLSFDDAYLSFYTHVYPLLREFRFPAVLAVVGKWIDDPHGGPMLFGDQGSVIEASFPSWGQLREMAASGFVEITSHTYGLHLGIPANPQGNLEPAATARIYDAATGSYENDAAWRARVTADLRRNSDVIERETGRRPRAIAWPYGAYNDDLVRIAGELGMPVAMTLDDGANTPEVPLTALRRTLILHNPALAGFVAEVKGPLRPEPVRAVQVDLGDVYSADPAQQERNLSGLLDRIKILRPSHVFLQATADINGDGSAFAAYFPTANLPLRADLFNRVAWQLVTRDRVKVYAVLPVAGFHLSREIVAGIYQDLARHAYFDGVAFEDKLESDGGRNAGTPEFTDFLVSNTRVFRAPLKTMRTLYPEVASATPPLARDLAGFLAAYDYTGLMAVPGDGSVAGLGVRLAALAADASGRPGNMQGATDVRPKVMVMFANAPSRLQQERRAGETQAGSLLAADMRALQLQGLLNFGYASDDFAHDTPPLAVISPAMSLRSNPLTPGGAGK
jgi:poly-beta-1,6-N-acetyl-D-glucosamine N-deacetylase